MKGNVSSGKVVYTHINVNLRSVNFGAEFLRYESFTVSAVFFKRSQGSIVYTSY
jgi:hypothetical protein